MTGLPDHPATRPSRPPHASVSAWPVRADDPDEPGIHLVGCSIPGTAGVPPRTRGRFVVGDLDHLTARGRQLADVLVANSGQESTSPELAEELLASSAAALVVVSLDGRRVQLTARDRQRVVVSADIGSSTPRPWAAIGYPWLLAEHPLSALASARLVVRRNEQGEPVRLRAELGS
ncbi:MULTISPECIES: hypothetical protein [Actinoalloteichus]|uniref:Uncharacterized protein n=1 Tax=Actinoalloteichus fjordicus TaxID=1612552 RepID=A0AAC9LFX6_9PSEU|nr:MULTISPECIES: hypothetical protein [Actinoalloteichus]APU16631.1 hypothetical protein UA74_23065 [Actinoalloteichus fjordicus]APU22697.1 hypothetical protein UA75_23575 [Actinoalloteichus sp. GBA129-24]